MKTNITKLHNGALEVSAFVKIKEFSNDIWLESQVYYGFTNYEARQKFKRHLLETGRQLA
jgi:hypothetical protein